MRTWQWQHLLRQDWRQYGCCLTSGSVFCRYTNRKALVKDWGKPRQRLLSFLSIDGRADNLISKLSDTQETIP